MRRKTDFYTMDNDSVRNIVMKPFNEHMKIYKDDKQKEAALKKK